MKSMSLRFFSAMLTMLLLYLTAFPKDAVVNAAWTPVPLRIDALADDWSGDTFAIEIKVGVDYAFRNDSEYLYILFIFKDPKYLSTISATGMTVYFSPEGKKSKDYGIVFIKKRVSADEFIALLESQQGPLPEERKAQIKTSPSYFVSNYQVINKGKEVSTKASEGSGEKAIFRSAVQDKMTFLEFAIPLTKEAAADMGIGAEPGKSLKIGFEWGGMTKEMRAALMRRRAAVASEASEGAKGFEVRRDESDEGPVIGSRDIPFEKGAKKYSFWVDVKLANNQ